MTPTPGREKTVVIGSVGGVALMILIAVVVVIFLLITKRRGRLNTGPGNKNK